MRPIHYFIYPDITPELSEILFNNDRKMVVVGVIGKSTTPHCNKLVDFDDLLDVHPALFNNEIAEGQIRFYFGDDNKTLYLNFQTTFDNYVLFDLAEKMFAESDPAKHFVTFNSAVRTRFARMLLFAIQVCHLIVLVEPGATFDVSYLSIFKSLKIIREKYVLKFLPRMLKNAKVGSFLGKDARMCSPRFIFLFDTPDGMENDELEVFVGLETEVEEQIYRMLRNEFIITTNSAMSLFSVSTVKQFVYYNKPDKQNQDTPLPGAIALLMKYLEKPREWIEGTELDRELLDRLRPYEGYGDVMWMPPPGDVVHPQEGRSLLNLLKSHVEEAFEHGFDDSATKYKGKNNFVIPSTKAWYELFEVLHKIFVTNPADPSYEAEDTEYRAFLDNFHRTVDIDERFFEGACEHGLELAMEHYRHMLPNHYSTSFHEQKYQSARELLLQYARGPHVAQHEANLKSFCDSIWCGGKQSCEYPSLRGNPCVLGKHKATDPTEHSSGLVYVSACTCGRIQGHRHDPYTIRQANFEYYQLISKICMNCNKLERITFPVFEPSGSDFRAAEFITKNLSNLILSENINKSPEATSSMQSHLSGRDSPFPSLSQRSQNSPPDLSFSVEQEGTDENENDPEVSSQDDELESDRYDSPDLDQGDKDNLNDITDDNNVAPGDDAEAPRLEDLGNDDDDDDDEDDLEKKFEIENLSDDQLDTESRRAGKATLRQPSTTEYLPGMLHAASPAGFLPQFPSWSLVCLGQGSIYTHNSGLHEHVQSGFLNGSNFLLPWDVTVNLEHAQMWAASYEKIRNRKKGNSHSKNAESNKFTLKVFVGMEYQCLAGHRFMLAEPDTIMHGNTAIVRDSGGKVVLNDMPIYFPCPCKNPANNIAQLMRVHIVTPKAPVHVIIDPKVKIFQNGMKNSFTFTTGMTEPIRLSQSSYWLLRLPFTYEGDNGPLMPPKEVIPATAVSHGVLLANMFGVKENEMSDEMLNVY